MQNLGGQTKSIMVFSEVAYWPAGRSVLGKTVPEYSRPRAQFFPNTDRPRPANNVFIFSLP